MDGGFQSSVTFQNWRRKEAGPIGRQTDGYVSSRHTPSGQLMLMAGLLARGSRLHPAFPALPASGICGCCSPLTVAGAATASTKERVSPCSLFTPRLSARGPSFFHRRFPKIARQWFFDCWHRFASGGVIYVITLRIKRYHMLSTSAADVPSFPRCPGISDRPASWGAGAKTSENFQNPIGISGAEKANRIVLVKTGAGS